MFTITRRRYLTLMGFTTVSIAPLLQHAAFCQVLNQSDEVVERWMNDWMGAAKLPVGALHLGRFKDPIYFLTKPISWKPNANQEQVSEVSVPKGFVTDFASIPRAFWSLLRPDGDYTYPAIIHDFLYWNQGTTRAIADTIFRLAMEDFGINAVTIAAIYNAVRLGGESAWTDNAFKKGRGERRILKRFPEDPRITWDQWNKETDVFDP